MTLTSAIFDNMSDSNFVCVLFIKTFRPKAGRMFGDIGLHFHLENNFSTAVPRVEREMYRSSR